MRRSVFKALATVSLAALVGVATSSQAMTAQSLGALKQTDKWKVGIVDPEGQSFCAMVNRFEQNVGLAFALSPEGYGSVAVDVANEQFSPGKTYDVVLKTNGKTISTFSGRATSARSVVVQVGQNAAFYDALKANAKLGIGMQQLDAEFALNKFAPSYSQLIDCAHTLTAGVNGKDGKMPAVKVKDVEKAALAPLDKELAELSGQKVADARRSRTDKAAAFDDADDSDAAIEVASAEPAKTAPVAVIGGQKPKTEVKTEEKPAEAAVERKLLASSKASPVAAEVPPADTGATARLWDERQATDAGRTRIAVLEHLKHEPQQPAAKPDIKFDTPAVETKTVSLQKQVAVTVPAPVPASKSAPVVATPVAAVTKSGPALVMTSSNDDAALKASLAKKQAEIAQLSAAAAERDALKKQLDAAKSDAEFAKARTALLQGQMLAAAAKSQKTATDKAQMDALQSQLAASEKQRQALETRLAEVGQQSKALNATLDQKQKELAKTAAGEKEIAAMKAEIARMQSGDAATIAELQKQMLAQKEQNESLRQQYAALEQKNQQITLHAQAALTQKHDSIRQELTRKEAYVSDLEQRLAKLEAEHAETSTRADQAQAALAAAQKDAKVARKSLIIINDDVVVPHVAAEVSAKAAAKASEKARADAAAHEAELAEARSRINALEQELNTTRSRAQTIAAATPAPAQKQAQVEDQRGKLATAQEEIDRLKMKNAELAGRLYNEAAEGRDNTAQNETLKGQRTQLEEAQALIERLKSENEKLAEKAATPAPAAAPVQVANAADKALIDRLKSENEALATKLSTISTKAEGKTEDKAAQQELAQSRARIAQLESQLHETREQQVAQQALPAPIAARSYVNAPVQPMTPVVSSPVVAAATPVTTPLPSRKPGVRTVMASAEKSVDVTRDILGIEPAAGDSDPLPALNEEWVEQAPAIHSAQAVSPSGKTVAVKTAAAKPAAAREEAAPVKQPTFFERISAPVAPVTAPTPSFFDRLAQKQAAAEAHRPVPAEATLAVPAAPVAPVFAAPTASADPGFDHNRAAAFLDRIMQQHRPGGAPQAASSADKAPIFAPVRRSAAPAIAPQNGSLSAIETAAGPAASTMPTGYAAKPTLASADDFPPPVTAPVAAPVAPTLASAPVKQPSAAPALETLLASAGISASPSAPQKDAQGSTIRQWTSEGISGMFEQIPAHNAFQANVASYIDRYREDCPALQTSISAPVQAAAGSVAQADIFCPTAGNTYSTTFVFWQDRASFTALLHSGYPDDAQKVKSMGTSIAAALGAQGTASAGLAPRQAAGSADAYVAPAADRQERRFNIPQQSTAAYTGGGEYATRPQGGAPHSFETVVIE